MKKKGVTLVELVAVIAIMAIVFGIIYNIFVSGNKIYTKGSNDVSVQNTARSVFITVGEDVKKAVFASVNSVTLVGGNKINAVNSSGTAVSFTITNTNSSIYLDTSKTPQFNCIYVELNSTTSYIYVVKAVNATDVKELHKISNTGVDTVIASKFDNLTFTEQDKIFTINVSEHDKDGNPRNYNTTVSLRKRK